MAAIWPGAYRTAVALCGGDRATAQDAAQNACLASFMHLPELRSPARFIPWFIRILTRAARKELKSNARWRSIPNGLQTRTAAPDDDLSFLRTCVLQLPKPLREAIVLNEIVGYSSAEVAAILGVPAGTVRFRVHQARAKLRAILKESPAATQPHPGVALSGGF